jgi:hypothetical protein
MPARRTFASAARLAPALCLVSVLGGTAAQQKPRVNADAAMSVEFLNRVQQYVDLHNKLESTLPPRQEQATPAEVQAHETALAGLIAKARSRAKQGDLLPQHIRGYLRRQIGRAIAGPEGRALRESIMEDNPAMVRLRVNGRYPDGIPRTTMPPPILGALPKLPEHLEYRFIGPRLVLLDSHAQLVVDYMDEALPK